MNVLIIDGYNMIHRCRFEWGGGLATSPNRVIYNFFRVLKAAVDRDSFDRVYFVTEGRPSHRLEIDQNYKANRVVGELSKEEAEYWSLFHEQKTFIIDLLSRTFPITVANHSDFEGDDVIYALIKNYHSSDSVEVVSSDTDFIQILNEFPNTVKLWNPIAKKYRENTKYDYVSWKAMVGDRSDNVPGIPRIGKKTAEKILTSPGEFGQRMTDLNFSIAFNNSYSLIKLSDMGKEFGLISFSNSKFDEEAIRESFCDMLFKFSIDDTSWEKYIEPFKRL